MINLLAAIKFPSGSGIYSLIYGLLKGMYSIFGEYAVAIVFFTLVIKIITLPLDFGNKYFSKKNSVKMAEIKPEEDRIKQLYANDPVALNRAKQELYKKHGFSQGGFCLFSLINIILTLYIFLSVFNGLRSVSNYNLNLQYIELQGIYQDYTGDVTGEEFAELINEKYNETKVGFLWVSNIWRPDSWASKTLSYGEFKSATKGLDSSIFKTTDGGIIKNDTDEDNALKAEYDEIFAPIQNKQKGWNGLLLLVIFAGATNYLSAVINAKTMAKQTAKKQETEPVVQYSMRAAKEQTNTDQLPQIDPAMMGNVMKFVLPVVMVIFTISSTAALAVYIISSSLITTGLTFGINKVIDKVIAKQDKTQKESDTIINPHAKYFKNRR